MNRILLFAITIILFFLTVPLFSEQIEFQADSMSGKTGKEADNTTLSGNAFVKTSSMEIRADSITLHGKDFRYITASGAVQGANTESAMDFTCGRLEYDRETKIATLHEKVSLTDTENDVKASAQIIEYNQNLEIAIMQINVNITQKNNVCTSAYAIYRKKAQMLNMSGNSKVVQDDDTFRAQEITLNLDTQEITLDGKVKGSVATTGGNESEKGEEQKSKAQSTQDVINDFNANEPPQPQSDSQEAEATTTKEQPATTEQSSAAASDGKTKKKKKSK